MINKNKIGALLLVMFVAAASFNMTSCKNKNDNLDDVTSSENTKALIDEEESVDNSKKDNSAKDNNATDELSDILERRVSVSGRNFCMDKKYTKAIELTLDNRWLVDRIDEYNEALAKFCAFLSDNIYSFSKIKIDGEVETDKTFFLTQYGFWDVSFYSINDMEYEADKEDVTDVIIGHKDIRLENELYDSYVVVVRGTDSSAQEWESNFDVGCDNEAYYDKTGKHPQWINKKNHKGFDVTANRVDKIVKEYIKKYKNENADRQSFLFTGHSRGAAVANILGAEYEKQEYISCAYTYNTPNVTTEKNRDRSTVFNIINEDDFISYMPIQAWGYKRYGNDIKMSIGDNEELTKYFKSLTKTEYECGIREPLVNIFSGFVKDTEDLYKWDEAQIYEINDMDIDEKELNQIINEYGLEKYAKIVGEGKNKSLVLCKAIVCEYITKLMEIGRDEGRIHCLEFINKVNKMLPSNSCEYEFFSQVLEVMVPNMKAFGLPHTVASTYSIVAASY